MIGRNEAKAGKRLGFETCIGKRLPHRRAARAVPRGVDRSLVEFADKRVAAKEITEMAFLVGERHHINTNVFNFAKVLQGPNMDRFAR